MLPVPDMVMGAPGLNSYTKMWIIRLMALFLAAIFISFFDSSLHSFGGFGLKSDVWKTSHDVSPSYTIDDWYHLWRNAGLLPEAQRENETGGGNNNSKADPRLDVKLVAKLQALKIAAQPRILPEKLFRAFPAPVDTNTVQIYNEKAYHELVQMFMTKQQNETIRICANGGSVTAGARVWPEQRFFTTFARYIRMLNLNALGADVEVIDRGHGTRHSLHSAVFAPNFLPPTADLILWEFSINDFGHQELHHIPAESKVDQMQSMLVAWLTEVERMQSANHPKVILIYLWEKPFRIGNRGVVENPVYDAHAGLAKKFDFVVGHVNVASYFDELDIQPENKELELNRMFVADGYHPGAIGHLVTAFLLLDLLRGKGRNSFPRSTWAMDADASPSQHAVPYEWFCGVENEDKRFVRSQVTANNGDNAPTVWRSPLGTASLEKPQNKVLQGSSRQLAFHVGSSKIHMFGKQAPPRIDQQWSVILPWCMVGASVSDYVAVSVPENAEPLQHAKSLFMGFAVESHALARMKKGPIDLKVYKNSGEQVDGRLIRVTNDWECSWTWELVYIPRWFVFSQAQNNVSSINLCVERGPFDGNNAGSQAMRMLISLAVY